MNFKPNDKVVCVGCNGPAAFNTLPSTSELFVYHGVKPYKNDGIVYVVREARDERIKLVGSVIIYTPTQQETDYAAAAFRKLEDIHQENQEKADIEALIKEAKELINLY